MRTKKKRRQESIGSSVDVYPQHLENRKEAGKEAQGAQGLSKNGGEGVAPLL